MWEYVKGSEADFEGAPEWCTHVSRSPEFRKLAWECSSRIVKGNSYQWVGSPNERVYENDSDEELDVVAERRKVDNLQSRVNDANLQQIVKVETRVPSKEESDAYNKRFDRINIDELMAAKRTLEEKGYTWCGGSLWKPPLGKAPSYITEHNKYNRQCKGMTIDVYDVLAAFNVTNPALQHLVKKALCTGLRGHKDKSQDLQDILDSAKRALELESGK